jgi:hypothetical protein
MTQGRIYCERTTQSSIRQHKVEYCDYGRREVEPGDKVEYCDYGRHRVESGDTKYTVTMGDRVESGNTE